MKRFTARWTTVLAATALLAAPATGGAQTRQTPSTTPAGDPSMAQAPAAGPQETALQDVRAGGREHLRRARATLDEISDGSLTGNARTRIAELKGYLGSLDQQVSGPADRPRSDSASMQPAAADRAQEETAAVKMAKIETAIGELLSGGRAAQHSGEPGAAGTSGAAGTADAGARGAALDEATRAKLEDVRMHVRAFAASRPTAGAPGQAHRSPNEAATSPTSASAPPSAASATAQSSQHDPTPTATGRSRTGMPQTAAPDQPPVTDTRTADPRHQAPAEGAVGGQQGEQQVDADAVQRHLTAARDTLSGLTQLPAAAQLTGEPRQQVSELISNFNELITTKTAWRGSYAKVESNLQALLGEEEGAAPASQPASEPGAVGTSGANSLDPEVRAKLVEFRSHLREFERAATHGTSGAGMTPESTATGVATRASATDPATASGSTSTGAQAGGPGGMPGTTAPRTDTGQQGARTGYSPADRAADPSAALRPGHAEAMRHIEAIEAVLTGATTPATGADAGRTAGTTGTAAEAAHGQAHGERKAIHLDAQQIQQIRTHLEQLRQGLNEAANR